MQFKRLGPGLGVDIVTEKFSLTKRGGDIAANRLVVLDLGQTDAAVTNAVRGSPVSAFSNVIEVDDAGDGAADLLAAQSWPAFVTQEAIGDDAYGECAFRGVVKCLVTTASGGVALGDPLAISDSNAGSLEPNEGGATAGSPTGTRTVAIALEASTNASSGVELLVFFDGSGGIGSSINEDPSP